MTKPAKRFGLRPDYTGASLLLWVLRTLVLLAIALASYLSWQGLMSQLPAGCGGGSGCETVLSSKWSKIGPVPVSLLALGIYLLLFVLSCAVDRLKDAKQLQLIWVFMLTIAFALIGSIAWYSMLQIWAVGAFCFYCSLSHILAFVISFVIFMLVPFAQDEEEGLVRKESLAGLSIGLIATAGLIGMQLLLPGQTGGSQKIKMATTQPQVVTTQPELTGGQEKDPVENQQGKEQLATTQAAIETLGSNDELNRGINKENMRDFTMHLANGMIKLPTMAYPLFGDINAKHHIAIMVDYNCPHCRDLHADILAWIKRNPGKLLVLLLPVPLNPDCNELYTRLPAERFSDSCDYAKLALALHHLKPEASEPFDRFMFKGENAPSFEDALAYAEKLAGKPLADRMELPITQRMLKQSVYINNNVFRGQALPILIMPKGQPISGRPDTDELEKMFEDFKL